MSNRDFDRERRGDFDFEQRRPGEHERGRGRPSPWFRRETYYEPGDDYGREGWTGFGAEGDWEGARGREGGYASYGREGHTPRRTDFGREGWGRGGDWGQEGRFRRGSQEGPYDSGYEGYWGYRGRGRYGEDYPRRGEESGRSGLGEEPPDWRQYGGRGYWHDYGWGPQWLRGRPQEGYGWEGREGSYGQGPGFGRSGQHVGRGPRGYQRSDERIREDVNDRLTEHGEIDATDIEVHVQNGEVTLKGQVDSRYSKRLAEDLAESILGVRDVRNEIRVQQQPMQTETRREAA